MHKNTPYVILHLTWIIQKIPCKFSRHFVTSTSCPRGPSRPYLVTRTGLPHCFSLICTFSAFSLRSDAAVKGIAERFDCETPTEYFPRRGECKYRSLSSITFRQFNYCFYYERWTLVCVAEDLQNFVLLCFYSFVVIRTPTPVLLLLNSCTLKSTVVRTSLCYSRSASLVTSTLAPPGR